MGLHTFSNKSWYYATFLIAAFPLFGIKITSITILIFVVTSIFSIAISKKNPFNSQNTKWILLFVAIYIIYLISSLFYPLDKASIFILEKKMGLFIFPFLLFLSPFHISKKHLNKLLLIFSCSTIVVVLYTNIIIAVKGIPHHYLEHHDWSYSYRNFFEDIIKIHPTYISMYLGFSILILIKSLVKSKKILLKIFSGIGIIICFIALIPLSAKMPLIASVVSIFIYLLMQPKIWGKAKLVFLGATCLLIICSITIPALKIRINEVVNSSFEPPHTKEFTSVNVRSGIFSCSIALVQENYFWGVGAGQLQNELNNCYSKFQTPVYSEFDYNTHNEYLNIWLGTGLIGLISILLLLAIIFYMTFKYKKALFFSFLILITLCFLTENLLDRQGGVIFFAFFTALFSKYYFLQKNVNSIDKY